jgi:membrane protein YqaA with SNARE-associated domain
MIIPMVIAKKTNYIKIFLIASIFSVLGGIFGYMLGAIFFDMAMSVIEFYGYEKKIIALKNILTLGEGFLAWLGILFLAGFTTIPYKAFTIASGLNGLILIIFVIVSL